MTRVALRTGVSEKQTELAVARATLVTRRADLEDFDNAYEDLVEVICSSAQFGANPKLCDRYVSYRHVLAARYQALRPFLISYLEFVPNDEEAGLKLCGRPLDAFEALFAAEDLQGFLDLDDGSMISRITRTREAISLYRSHLDLLAARLG